MSEQILDTNKNDNSMDDVKQLNMKYEDLLLIASGELESGEPSSIATVAIDRLTNEGEQVTDMQMIIQSAYFSYFASGGCLVVQIDFPQKARFEYERTINIVSTFLSHSQDEEYLKTHGLGVVVVPMALEGQITMLLQDLVYFTGFDMPEYGTRLIMCFNDLATVVTSSGEEINYEELNAQARAQALREKESIQQQIDAVEQEIYEMENQNPYQQKIQEQLAKNNGLELETEKEQEKPYNPFIRSSQD